MMKDAKSAEGTAAIREIDPAELDQISGGIIPFAVGWAVVHIGTALASRIVCE